MPSGSTLSVERAHGRGTGALVAIALASIAGGCASRDARPAGGAPGSAASAAAATASRATGPAPTDSTSAEDIDSTWVTPDSSWVVVRSTRWGVEFRKPPDAPLRLRGPAQSACIDSLPPAPPSAAWSSVEGDTTLDIAVMRVYFTRATLRDIADYAGFDSLPSGWSLNSDQGSGPARVLGGGHAWRGLEASAFGHFGHWEPEGAPGSKPDSTGMDMSGAFDLRVAVAAFTRADGCQVVLEIKDPTSNHVWRGVFSTVRLQ